VVIYAVMFALGALVGTLVSYQIIQAGLTSAARHNVEELRLTLDGLEATHAMRIATLEAERELTRGLPQPKRSG